MTTSNEAEKKGSTCYRALICNFTAKLFSERYIQKDFKETRLNVPSVRMTAEYLVGVWGFDFSVTLPCNDFNLCIIIID